MNYFKEKKYTFWVILLLLLLNLSTLAMVWVHKPPQLFLPPPRSEKLIPDFVIAELKLNPAQKLAFEESENQQMRKITPLLDSLHQCKQHLFLLAFQASTDTSTMIAYTHQIGNISEKIDEITFFHVIELKQICHLKQQEMLEDLFKDMGKLRRNIMQDGKPPEH